MRKILLLALISVNLLAYSSFRVGMSYGNMLGDKYPKTNKSGINVDIQKGTNALIPDLLVGGYVEGNVWNYNRIKDDGFFSISGGMALSYVFSLKAILQAKFGYELINFTTNPSLPRQYNAHGFTTSLNIFSKIDRGFAFGAGYETSIGTHRSAFDDNIKINKFMIYLLYLDL